MAKHERRLSFTFVNPNSGRSFEREFRRILIERLMGVQKQARSGGESQ